MNLRNAIQWGVSVWAVLCFMALPAQAGIIITEGKIATEGKSPDSKQSSGRRGATKDSGTVDGVCASIDEDGYCVQTDETVDDVDFDDVDDIEIDDPNGWSCKDIGGGLEYCEPATGSSPGAGAGGSLSADAELDGSGEAVGCQGGGTGSAWHFLWVLLFLVGRHLMPKRRVAGI